MRYFFRRYIPDLHRVLLVESGSRALFNDFIPRFRSQLDATATVDLVTCYNGRPTGLAEQSPIFHVADFPTPADRQRLFAQLKDSRYDALGIICSDEDIMTKWKWALAYHVPAKLLIINENGDYFWADWGNWAILKEFALVRAGLAGAGAVRTLARVVLFPFTLLYLLLFAAMVHCARKLRT